jgi:mannan endo-1,4-beta-mannosidase
VTESTPEPEIQWGGHRKPKKPRRRHRRILFVVMAIGTAVIIGAAIPIANALRAGHAHPSHSLQRVRYLGVFEPDAPGSYAGINKFAHAIGRQPNVVPYYSHWLVPFDAAFARSAAEHGALTLVQIAPKDIALASISSGRYDTYLRSYAAAVKAFGGHVVLSFGHEMNGSWYSWGYRHTAPGVFVAAWRHIVTLFRKQGVRNVSWLWTINIIGTQANRIPAPSPWWPGKSYVNWVGIDGYYWSPSAQFASVFGPTIAYMRRLTSDPILIAETGATPSVGQPAKINDLFAGVRTFGLLGFIYFNDDVFSAAIPGESLHWQLSSPAALATLRHDAKAFMEGPGQLSSSMTGSSQPSSPQASGSSP